MTADVFGLFRSTAVPRRTASQTAWRKRIGSLPDATRRPASSRTLVSCGIADGTDAAAHRGSVRLEGERIVTVGDIAEREGDLVIEVGGVVVPRGKT